MLVTIDEADLAAEAAELMPSFRHDARALAEHNHGFLDAILSADRAACDVSLGFDRHAGKRTV